jgi:glucokinase
MTRRVAIGVDVGGTKILGAAVDLRAGTILHRDEIMTRGQDGGGRVLERLHDLIDALHGKTTEQGLQVLGVGIGVPELVDNSGTIQSDWNFDWNRRKVTDRLVGFGPVIVESDARTGALAELHFGHGQKHPSFVFVTIGTGLSFAFCSDGRIHRGANGYAIHFGSSDIMAVCAACGAQEPFNLEALASGKGLAETFQRQTNQALDARALIDGVPGDAPGDPGARLVDQATTAMASYLGQLVNILDPHAVIIGGGLGRAPRYFEALEKKTRPFIWSQSCRALPILTSALPQDGAAIGAAALFRDGD